MSMRFAAATLGLGWAASGALAASNPVYEPASTFADPAVLRVPAQGSESAWYYAYATQLRREGKFENVQAARSRDLVTWEKLPDAMPEKPEWASKRQNFWAPHVSRIGTRYVMYISAEQNEWGFCVAAGTSDNPGGPFRGFKRLACGRGFENIDPMQFTDPVSGRSFLYWGSAHQPLLAQELSEDGLSFKEGSKPKPVVLPVREMRGAIKTADGWTYAFGTQIEPQYKEDGPLKNVQAARSKDLMTWERLPDAMPVRPQWATGRPDHWAPQVEEFRDGDKTRYRMYLAIEKGWKAPSNPRGFSAGDRIPSGTVCISVGVADQPGGPYADWKRMDCDPGYKLVNPRLGTAPGTGKRVLHWERPEKKKVHYRELSEDGFAFVTGGQKGTTPFQPTEPELKAREHFKFTHQGYENLIEGAWVSYRNGFYYLYYSGNECCGPEAHYAVLVARSRDPLGPFEKLGSLVLKGDDLWLGPGHNSVVEDDAAGEWMVYHAIDAKKPKVRVSSKETEPRRVMLIQKLAYGDDGWPRLEGGPVPARELATVPRVSTIRSAPPAKATPGQHPGQDSRRSPR